MFYVLQIAYNWLVFIIICILAMEEDEPNCFQEMKRKHHSELKAIRRARREDIYLKKRREMPHASEKISESQLQKLESLELPENALIKKDLEIFDQMRREEIKEILELPIQELTLQNALEEMWSQNSTAVHFGTISLRRMLVAFETEEMIQIIMDSGAITRLRQLFEADYYPHLRYESSWILQNLTSQSDEACERIANHKIQSSLMRALDRNEKYLIHNMIAILGNLAAGGAQIRNVLVEQGLILKLDELASQNLNNSFTLCQIIWAMSNILRVRPQLEYEEAIPALKFMCKALCLNFYDSQPSQADDIFKSFLVYRNSQAQQLLDHENVFIETVEFSNRYWNQPDFKEPLHSAACLLSRTSQTSKFFKRMVSPSLFELCQKGCKNTNDVRILKEYLFFVSNFCTQDAQLTDRMLANQQFFVNLSIILRESEVESIKKQVLFIFGNASFFGNPRIMVRYLMQYEILQDFADCLLNSSNAHFISDLLENLFKILKKAISPKWSSLFKQYSIHQTSVQIKEKNPLILKFLTVPHIAERLQQLQYLQNELVYMSLSALIDIFRQDGWQWEQV